MADEVGFAVVGLGMGKHHCRSIISGKGAKLIAAVNMNLYSFSITSEKRQCSNILTPALTTSTVVCALYLSQQLGTVRTAPRSRGDKAIMDRVSLITNSPGVEKEWAGFTLSWESTSR